MSIIRLICMGTSILLLAACVTTPPPAKKVNPITRLPTQNQPVPIARMHPPEEVQPQQDWQEEEEEGGLGE